MLVVDKNTTPLDWLKFELEQQQQHLQAMQAVYADKYVKGKKATHKSSKGIKSRDIPPAGANNRLRSSFKHF